MAATSLATGAALFGVAASADAAPRWSGSELVARGAGELVSAVGPDGTAAVAWADQRRGFDDNPNDPSQVRVRVRDAAGRFRAERALGPARELGGVAVTRNGTAAVFTNRNANDRDGLRWIARSDSGWKHIADRGEYDEYTQLLPLQDGRLLSIGGGEQQYDYAPISCVVGETRIGGCRPLGMPIDMAPETVVQAGNSLVGVGDLEEGIRQLGTSGSIATPLTGKAKPTIHPFGVEVQTPPETTSDLDARSGQIAWVSETLLKGVYYAVGTGSTLQTVHHLPWTVSGGANFVRIVAEPTGGATLVWVRAIADSNTGSAHWARITADGAIADHGVLDSSVAVDNLDLARVGDRTIAVWQVHRKQARLRSAELGPAGPRRLAFRTDAPQLATTADSWALSAAGDSAVLVRNVGGKGLLWISTLRG